MAQENYEKCVWRWDAKKENIDRLPSKLEVTSIYKP